MSVPLVHLPPLDFVRGFVAVGRRMSITLAAEDLCLTQSAVSRQVHALEQAMGLKLLVRGHRAVSFTPEGERFFKAADAALQQLQEVLGPLDQRQQHRPVTITAAAGVAGLWLLPRLESLQQALPGIDVRVATSEKIVDLRDGSADIAIRYCPEGADTDGAIRLFDEEILPVAHPSLCAAGARLQDVIEGQVLLEFEDARRPWLQWAARLSALGLGGTSSHVVLRFTQYDQVIHAATAGRGIALGRRALVEPMLRDGRLIALEWGTVPLRPGHAYWLMLSSTRPRHDVERVARWIESEVAVASDRAAASTAAAR